VALNKLNHIYGEPLVVSSLNTTGDTVVDGALTVLGSSNFVGAVTFGNVSNAELQYLDGLTGNIQAQLDTKVTAAQVAGSYAPLSGAAFTGAISATGLTLTNDLTIANGGTGLSATTKGGIFVGNSTTDFTNLTVGLDGYLLTADSAQATGVKWAAAPVSLPTQTGNNGKYLTTDGSTASWATLGSSIPSQTGNTGKFLTTDGTSSSWATLTASNLTGGTLSSTILGNSNVFIGTTSVALNRTTANLALTGITSVAFPGSTSGTTTLQASAAAGTTTVTLPAASGTVDLVGNTFFVGTTSIANNRASASQTLTGVSIDGNAATATTASGVAAANISGTTLNAGVVTSSLTTVGTITTGTWSGSFGAVSGANLTSLTAGNLSGTIPTGVLGNSSLRVGTTSIALNRASASQTLTGVSIDGNAATVTNGITTSNYTSYSPTLTGGGASGTWGISITGNAATATTAAATTNGLTTSNYSSYALPLGGGSMSGLIVGSPTGVVAFTSANDNGNFSVRSISSNASSPAVMSFHRPGIYAINMGLDTDNVFKIGGWSAGIVSMSLTGGGSMTLAGTLTINSDIKLKENLVPLTGALDKVKALTGYNYNRIGSETLEMGVVAQEVQKIAPELVLEDSEGTLSVAYQNMVALLIEAVKEQSAEIAALKEQVEELKG
jgi:hypothetical protein